MSRYFNFLKKAIRNVNMTKIIPKQVNAKQSQISRYIELV